MLPVLMAAFVFSACQRSVEPSGEPAATHDLTLKFEPLVGTQPLVFGNTYTNAAGEDFSVSAFKFYITKVRLTNTETGTSYNLNQDEYFLVNFADDNSIELKLKAVPGTYNRIGFQLGVDSIRNVSGAQTGALDPAKGMFWTWNSGYIMAKLEGNSPVSTQPNNVFEYHIGGFSGSNSVIKQLSLPFPAGQKIGLQANRSSEMTITADVAAWFSGPNNIQLSKNAVCMSPGALAKQISDNYAGMFTVTDIVNN